MKEHHGSQLHIVPSWGKFGQIEWLARIIRRQEFWLAKQFDASAVRCDCGAREWNESDGLYRFYTRYAHGCLALTFRGNYCRNQVSKYCIVALEAWSDNVQTGFRVSTSHLSPRRSFPTQSTLRSPYVWLMGQY